jgi:hypothetical protein
MKYFQKIVLTYEMQWQVGGVYTSSEQIKYIGIYPYSDWKWNERNILTPLTLPQNTHMSHITKRRILILLTITETQLNWTGRRGL